jgi:hypothetical protein
MSPERNKIEFVLSSSPGSLETVSAEVQRRVHSHAARAAHAKARRQRLIEYQKLKATGVLEDGHQALAKDGVETGILVLPSPVGPLVSERRDPFASFARRLNPTEEFLVDYCKSSFLTFRKGRHIILCISSSPDAHFET